MKADELIPMWEASGGVLRKFAAAVELATRKDCGRIATDQIQGPPCDEWDRAVSAVADAIGASC